MSKGTKQLIIVAVIVLLIGVLIFLFCQVVKSKKSNNKPETKVAETTTNVEIPDGVQTVTKDFGLNSYSALGKKVTFGAYIYTPEEDISLEIDAKKFNLPKELYNYRSFLNLRITYSESDSEIYNCQVVNLENGEIVSDLSEDNLKKTFDIEYGKKIIEKDWQDIIVLSELEPNKIYKFVTNEDIEELPTVENDIGKNCMVYLKRPDVFGEYEDATYEKNACLYNSVTGIEASMTFSYYSGLEKGQYICVMYKEAETEELVKTLDDSSIIKVSDYPEDGEIDDSFSDYIYNDTEEDVKLITSDSYFDETETEEYTLKAGEIYEYDWMIDSATIEH